MSSPATSTLTPSSAPHLGDDLIALATPAAPAVRAVIRLSGPGVWRRLRGLTEDGLPPDIRRGQWRIGLRLPGWSAPVMVDLSAWAGPRSFTGQDLLEIGCLGAPPLVQAILTSLLTAGCRLARPGEFLWRAFLAGKVDLTRVDALQGMLAAGSRAALHRAAGYALGGQTPPLANVRDQLLDLLAEVEAGLDFADEDLSFIAPEALASSLAAACRDLEQIQQRLAERGAATDRLRVVLAGLPNAGKSSLFNALLGADQALVSPQAGTTRDFLSAVLRLGPEVEVELIDTAGLEELASERIAHAAQARRAEQTEQADIVLWCRDASDVGVAVAVPAFASGLLLEVWTKCDVAAPPDPLALAVSSHSGRGLNELRQTLRQLVEQTQARAAGPSLAVGLELVAAAQGHALAAAELAAAGQPPELVAVELRLALDALGQLVGAVFTEDLLGRVFSQFCIGK